MVTYTVRPRVQAEWDAICDQYDVDAIVAAHPHFYDTPSRRARLTADLLRAYTHMPATMAEPA